MMKLCPIRYGGAVAAPPSYGGWIIVEQPLGTFAWDYDFTSSTPTYDSVGNIPFWNHYYGRYYRSEASTTLYHINDTQLLTNSFTAEGTFYVSSGGGELIFGDPDYVYMCGGVQPINRMDVPYSSASFPTADSQSRANTGVFLDGVLYVASIYSQSVTYSSDNGATWATKANPFASITSGATNAMFLKASTTGGLVVAFQNGVFEAYEIKIGLSNDLGDTWTYASHTIPVPLGSSSQLLQWGGFLQSGSKLFYITTDGYCGVSYDDGATWTAKTQLPAYNPNNAAIGGDKIVVGCGYNRAYESTDDGATWNLITLNSAPTGGTSDYVWVGYLG